MDESEAQKQCVLLIPAPMQVDLCKFQVSQVYTGNSRLARNTEQGPVSKNQGE